MSENGSDDSQEGLRGRITSSGEEAIGKIANQLLGNPVVNNAIQGVMEASEKVSQAQDMAMGALNLPKAGDLDKLQRRVRSLSERLDRLEDTVDGVEDKLAQLNLDQLGESLLTRLEQKIADAPANGRG